MDSSTKRKVGALALIVAGIGAFLVPFLLHGPALQASNNGGGNTNGNNNNGGTTPTGTSCTSNCNPTPSCTSNCTPPTSCTTNCSTDTTPPPCTSDPTTTSHSNEGKHLAKGHDKQDNPDTSLTAKAHGFMAALAKHNPMHDATHSTKTDNDTDNSHGVHSSSHDTADANACADNKDNESSDNETNDD
jgi:hypothetical protein